MAPLVQNSSTEVTAPPLQPDAPATAAEPAAAGATETNPGAKLVSTAVAFETAMREVQSNLAAEQWYQALFVLSKFYGSPDLPEKQQQELVDLLDPLAAKVVYSPQHLVTDAYEVRRGDTLPQIGAMYQVPPELLANINGVDNPNLLVPGTKLKVVRGPFRADISLQKKELTLFVGQLYAGRFPVSIGQDPAPQPGEYRVVEKQPGRDYFPSSGPLLAANDPQNPFGRVWIGLDKQLAIHGSPERGDPGTAGCISLSPLDAGDVYSILTVGSSVVIRP
jgi:lipoprotein-anchoring transpeptidase ErfK/SrfK